MKIQIMTIFKAMISLSLLSLYLSIHTHTHTYSIYVCSRARTRVCDLLIFTQTHSNFRNIKKIKQTMQMFIDET